MEEWEGGGGGRPPKSPPIDGIASNQELTNMLNDKIHRRAERAEFLPFSSKTTWKFCLEKRKSTTIKAIRIKNGEKPSAVFGLMKLLPRVDEVENLAA